MTPTPWPAMQSYLPPENEPWLELVLVLAVGTAVIVGLAALAERFVRSAIWQRTIWQIATLGVLTLMLVELTGTAPALVRLWRVQIQTATTRPRGTPPAAEEQPPDAAVEPSATEDRRLLEQQGFPPAAGGFAETGRPVAAASDFAWFDDPDLGGNEAADRTFFATTGEEPVYVSRSTTETCATATGATGGLPASAKSNPVAKTLVDEPPPANAFWWLGVIWALGAMLIAARTVCARALLFALWRRRTRVSDGPPCEPVGRLSRRLGIRRRVCVLEAVGLSAPVAFGYFRPTVALPVTFTDDFDRRQQEAVLAHELAHLAARDPAWQVLANLLSAALWWHPLVWWSRHRLRAASEAAADEASLLVPGGPDLLAACLVAMGRRLVPPPPLGWLSVEGPGFRSHLGRRVERLLNLRTRPWRAPGRGRLALAKTALPVALVTLTVCCTAWARPQATLSEGGTTMNVLRASWRRSLAAAGLALFTAGCSDAVADDPPSEQSLPAAVAGDLSDADGQLALLAEGEEAEAREREQREHEEGEARERREREQRERRDLETGRARLTSQLHELEERAQRIRRELEGLRDDQDAEARELQNALRGVEERMGAIRRELRGPEHERERPEIGQRERAELEEHLDNLRQRSRELDERAAAIRRELQGVRRDDQAEEARQLQNMLREVRGAAERVEGEMREIIMRLGRRPERPDADRPRPEREQLISHLEELRREIGRLSEGGPQERAEQLEREAREIIQRLERRPDRPRPGPPVDLERQIYHMRAAIENLRAGGFHDLAELLAREASKVLKIGGQFDFDPQPRPPQPPRPPEPREGPPRPEMAPRLEQQGRAIKELSNAVRQLRREMNEMREMLQQLLDRPR